MRGWLAAVYWTTRVPSFASVAILERARSIEVPPARTFMSRAPSVTVARYASRSLVSAALMLFDCTEGAPSASACALAVWCRRDPIIALEHPKRPPFYSVTRASQDGGT